MCPKQRLFICFLPLIPYQKSSQNQRFVLCKHRKQNYFIFTKHGVMGSNRNSKLQLIYLVVKKIWASR